MHAAHVTHANRRRPVATARMFLRRVREHTFWLIQSGVIAATAAHLVAERLGPWSRESDLLSSMHHIPVTLYVIPIAFAGLRYGFEGGVLTGIWCAALTVPNIALWHRESFAWLGETTYLLFVVSLGAIVAIPVERERSQRWRAEATSRKLALLNEVATTLSQPADLNRALDSVLARLVDVMGLETVGVALHSKEGNSELLLCRSAGHEGCEAPATAAAEGTFERAGLGPASPGHSVITVPLAADNGAPAGALGAVVGDGRAPTAEDTEILRAVASQVGAAIENARLHRQEKERLQTYVQQVTRAQEEERKRIARELHDEVAQALVLVCRRLDALAESGSAMAPAQPLEELRGLAEGSLESLRRFSRDLRPAMLDDLGLVPSLEWLASDLGRRTGIKADIVVSGERRRLAGETEVALFRIAQEALRNVERHSLASRAEVAATFENEGVGLDIQDNGRGFAVPNAPDGFVRLGKLGVVGMYERAQLVGGALEISSEPGRGTRISVRVRG